MTAPAPTLFNGEARFVFLNSAFEPVAADSPDAVAFGDHKTGMVYGDTLPERLTAKQHDAVLVGATLCGEPARGTTATELLSLWDETRHDPATFPELARFTKSGWYRSSSVVSSDPDYRWGVGFYHGTLDDISAGGSGWVRLCRVPVAALPRQSSAL